MKHLDPVCVRSDQTTIWVGVSELYCEISYCFSTSEGVHSDGLVAVLLQLGEKARPFKILFPATEVGKGQAVAAFKEE